MTRSNMQFARNETKIPKLNENRFRRMIVVHVEFFENFYWCVLSFSKVRGPTDSKNWYNITRSSLTEKDNLFAVFDKPRSAYTNDAEHLWVFFFHIIRTKNTKVRSRVNILMEINFIYILRKMLWISPKILPEWMFKAFYWRDFSLHLPSW